MDQQAGGGTRQCPVRSNSATRSIVSVTLCTAVLLLFASCVNPLLKLKSAVVSPPSMSPAGGVFGTDQSVTLSDTTGGVTIYYTTDGSTPTTGSSKYSGAIPIAGNGTKETIKAIAFSSGNTSGLVEATFTINYSIGGTSTLASPTFSPAAGVFSSAPSGGVSLSGPSGASIYYTTNGSAPSAANGTLYGGPIAITNANGATTTLKAVSVESGLISSPVVTAAYEVNFSQVSTPQVSVAGGSYSADQTNIVLSVPSAPAGTKIYYSETSGTSGTTPTTSSTVYTSPLSVTGNGTVETIEAIATAPGYAQSTVRSATYIINYGAVAAPSFSIAAGSYSANQSVALSDAASGATIYYTTNGTTPTTSSTVYTTAIPVTGDGTVETIEAIATATGYGQSTVASATYRINYNQASTPSFSVGTGSYSSNQSVTITDATGGATIYYTTDGTMPTTSSTVYSTAIPVTGDGTVETIEAIATATGYGQSTVASATYHINYSQASTPSFGVTGGSYSSNQSVTITDATGGATIYYTTDGTMPTTSSAVYSTAIPVTGNGTVETIEAIATATGYGQSTVASATYRITYGQVSSPSFSVAGGIYPSNKSLTITDATGGATIYYTTDGTTPTTSSPSGPATGVTVTVSGSDTGPVNTTVEAMAVATGMTNSAETISTYTISYPADSITPTISITPTGGADTESADGSHITASAAPTITISGATASTLYYTYALNGTPATPSIGGSGTSTGAGPSASFPLTNYGGGSPSTVTVEAFSVEPQTTGGALVTATFTINAAAVNPSFSTAPARYSSDQTLKISDTTTGATVYVAVAPNATTFSSPPNPAVPSTYTNTGSPSTSVSLVGPLQSYAVEAIAAAPGYTNSGTISSPPAQPYLIVYPKIVESTQGTYTFTVPNGLPTLSVTVKVWGGGGSGATTATGTPGTGGGGGYAQATVNALTSPSSFTVDVGAGAPPTGGAGLGGGESDFTVTSGGSTTVEAVAGGGGGGGQGLSAFSGSNCSAVPGATWTAPAMSGGIGGAGGQAGTGGSVETVSFVEYLIGCSGIPAGTSTATSDGSSGGYPGSGGGGGAGGGAAPPGIFGSLGGAGLDGSGGGGAPLAGSGGVGYGGGGGGGDNVVPGTAWTSIISASGSGGGGGGNYGSITIAGNYQTPGNTSDSDYAAAGGASGRGGSGGAPGNAGLAVIYLN